jgi:hypothetical protein
MKKDSDKVLPEIRSGLVSYRDSIVYTLGLLEDFNNSYNRVGYIKKKLDDSPALKKYQRTCYYIGEYLVVEPSAYAKYNIADVQQHRVRVHERLYRTKQRTNREDQEV